jgi:hypothetical protein
VSLASILLALAALACVGIGFLTTPIPVVGTVFSFLAPALALAGVVAGGVALSRARRAAQAGDAAVVGIVLGALALVPALLVAMTCGVCNALFTAGGIEARRGFDVRFGSGRALVAPDAGPSGAYPPARSAVPAPRRPPSDTPPDETPAPGAPRDRAAPPPAFPPPPLLPQEETR